MTVVYLEGQYDPDGDVVRMQASPGFGAQPYRVTVHVDSEPEAVAAYEQFQRMYRDLGCEVKG